MNKEHLHPDGRPYTKEEFVEKIKKDKSFAKRFGNLGPVYGKQWRSWIHCHPKIYPEVNQYEQYISVKTIDQIANLISDLKTNPDSRRLMVSAWNVGELDQMTLPPCHYGFQVYTRKLIIEERVRWAYDRKLIDYVTMVESEELDKLNVPKRAISLMWNQRSVDTFLGLPFNIASYGLLLEIIAKAVNMVPDELIGNLGDVHLYSNHIEQAKEQIGRYLTDDERRELWNLEYIPSRTREPYPLPTLKHMKTDAFYKSLSESVSLFTHLDNTDFEIENYQSHPTIKAPLSN